MPETRLKKITHLFIDVGGVLLSDGWNRHARRRAANHFKLDLDAMEERHHITDGVYEEGRLSLKEYLNRVVFCEPRSFTHADFRNFMFAQSTPFPQMLALAPRLKAKHGLKITVVSNEARELNAHRIQKFKLNEFVDTFVSSCFVHMRKPDENIFKLALDVSQATPEQVVYVENTAMFVEIAAGMGIRGIVHTDYATTRAKLAELGLEEDAH